MSASEESQSTLAKMLIPGWKDKPEQAYPVQHISCRDRRLKELVDQVFSSEMKIPSLKFSLLLSYAGFLGACIIGMVADACQLPAISFFVKVALTLWFGAMASLLAPLFYIVSSENASNPIFAFSAIPLCLFIYPLSKYLLQPSYLELGPDRVALQWKIGPFVHSRVLTWAQIHALNFQDCENANTDEWRLLFKGPRDLGIRLGSISDSVDRSCILKYLQHFAPDASVDHRILQAWTPVHNHSYTEIWLQSLASPPKRARLAPLEEGMFLQEGRFEIIKVLASGGQAVVYLAQSKSENSCEKSTHVLKEMVLPIYGDENLRRKELERFENESRLLSSLSNRHIVKLQEFFIEDHRAYLVLDYVEGSSLAELVKSKGALPESQVLELAIQMCQTLAYLHGLTPPVVHRDFTPDNLILTGDGNLVLIDFNVAHEAKFTTTATVVGKHAYLPPEQFRGKPCPQSDIYALGGTLHFLLTATEPEPITSSHPILVNSCVSADLDHIVAKATEPELASRYANIAELEAELCAVLEKSSAQIG